ncbi:hypothetical protein [Pseudomonas purpurea]|uniref:hypothetical protein n=1 Tax=Pseudomonas purpurea TaxID=3136737 RepID=UPI003267FCBB
MHKPKFPSEEQGGYDPIPIAPERLSPGRTTVHPDSEPGLDEWPESEGAWSLDEGDETAKTPDHVRDKP